MIIGLRPVLLVLVAAAFAVPAHATETYSFNGSKAAALELALLRIMVPLTWNENQTTMKVHAEGLVCARNRKTGWVDCAHDLPWLSKRKLARAAEHAATMPPVQGETRYDETKVKTVKLDPLYTRKMVEVAEAVELPFVEDGDLDYLLVRDALCRDTTVVTDQFLVAMRNRQVKSCVFELDFDMEPDLKREMKLQLDGEQDGPDLSQTH